MFFAPELEGTVELDANVFVLAAPDGSARLLDLNGSFYAIDQVAAIFLRITIQDGCAAAIQEVSSRFGAPQDRVREDLRIFLQKLRKERLIRPLKPSVASRNGNQWGSAVLGRILAAIRHIPWDYPRIICLFVLARVSFWILGWARTVSAWNAVLGIAHECTDDGNQIQQISETVRRIGSRHWIPMECKERAICCWTLLKWSGIPATLIVGIALYPFGGHCWCTCGDEIVGDDPDRCSKFTAVVSYR